MQAVVLAAGSSSRFWPLNTRHKSLTKVQGETLLEHTLGALRDADVTDVIIVEGPEKRVSETITAPADVQLRFVTQDEPKGMGNALEQAQEHVEETFVVTGPYRTDVGRLLEHMPVLEDDYAGAVVGAQTAHPERYGVLELSNDRDYATGLVEKPERDETPSEYKIVSTYILRPEFFSYLDAAEEHEYNFEDALDQYMQENTVTFTELDEEPPSLKYPWDLFDITETLLDAQEPNIADSADIAENATIDGNVVIGENTRVYENAVIRGPCYIGNDCIIGNNAVVRAYTNVEDDSTVGTNMELRGTITQEGFSSHSGFVGDSIIGQDVSLGAGIVTANRLVRDEDGERPEVSVYVRAKDERVPTGRDRLGMIVGDNVDVGTQANIMPGVCVGAGTFVGPSTFVKHNLGEHKKYFTKMDARELERR